MEPNLWDQIRRHAQSSCRALVEQREDGAPTPQGAYVLPETRWLGFLFTVEAVNQLKQTSKGRLSPMDRVFTQSAQHTVAKQIFGKPHFTRTLPPPELTVALSCPLHQNWPRTVDNMALPRRHLSFSPHDHS